MKQKAAMFGLDARIKKYCHSGDNSSYNPESMYLLRIKSLFKTKKAAMFGLDARVALAIFGALSIITGATLYNALQHIKTV
ncbi:MAG: hypothetical protein GY793_02585, partial [Proteobacteria bacterium]|nr:hypothetical protein [Pseudomonadota bacterium]